MNRISRRGFLGAAGAALLAGVARRITSAAETRKPNIVFILIDDMGWPDTGCYGNRFNETPNVDKLASQGMRFTDAYAACPVCSPTRASIMSGQYPAHVGITDFIPGHQRPYAKLKVPVNRTQYLPLDIVTLAEALKPAGYTCGCFGKWHLGGREHFPDTQGFDSWVVSNGRHFNFKTVPPMEIDKNAYLSEFLTDQAEKFLEENREGPFCLYLSHFAVHVPLEARQALIEKYEKKPKPDTGINNPVYAAMVEHVDHSVGRIMAKLDELGLVENTVVVRQRYDLLGGLVSSNAPLREEKGTLYEGGIREPLIVRWPGVVEPGSTCSEPVSSVDYYPTLVDIAGAPPPVGQVLDGVSIRPLLEQAGGLKRDAIYWHYPHYHHSTPAGAIRAGDWKLIEFFEDGRLELYNLAEDISESRNLAAEMPEKVAELREKLAVWRHDVNAAMPKPNPDYDPARAHEWGTPIRVGSADRDRA
jgi:uncharacterized sulfatase